MSFNTMSEKTATTETNAAAVEDKSKAEPVAAPAAEAVVEAPAPAAPVTIEKK